MHAPGVVLDGAVVFRQTHPLLGISSGALRQGHEPSEGVMIRPDGKLGARDVGP